MASKGKKLFANIIYMFIGNFASKFLSVLLVPLYTSVLSTEQYGICDMVFTTVTLLMPVFTLTVYEPMLRFSLDSESDKSKIFWSGIAVAGLGFGALFAVSPVILLLPSIRDYYWLCVAYYLCHTLYQCLSYYIRGVGEVRAFTLAGFANTACMLGLNILFLLGFGWKIEGYILASTLANLIAVAAAVFAGRIWRYAGKIRRPDRELTASMVRYAVPLIPMSISWRLSTFVSRYLITLLMGVGFTGIYSAANKIPTIINSVAYVVNAAWQLSSVEDFGSDSSRKLYSEVYGHFFALLSMAAAGIIFLTRPLALILYKAEFYEAWRYVPVLTLAVMIYGLCGFLETVYKAVKQTKRLLTTTLLGAASTIVLGFPLIYTMGLHGAAITTLAGYAVVFAFRLKDTGKILPFEKKTRRSALTIALLAAETVGIVTDTFAGAVVAGACLAAIIAMQRGTIAFFAGLAWKKFGKLLGRGKK